MPDYKMIRDHTGKTESIETNLDGYYLLRTPRLNKGCAFTDTERKLFHLEGLLPTIVETLAQQTTRMYLQYKEQNGNLGKNIYLNMLHDYNETLFYKLVSEHLEEMLPIIYTPTVGEAVKRFSLEHRKTRGIYINFNDKKNIKKILDNVHDDIHLCVITDGEAVLGIGDQGIGGINISIAKLMVYSLCGGINPAHALPIQLDVGTNNVDLLNDPMYLGQKHERISGQAYDEFIEELVHGLTKRFPYIYIHWEDLAKNNARHILDRYRHQICTLNGDMQGTGAVALSCLIAGAKASGIPLSQHRIVIMGAGTAGTGIADQIYQKLLRDGLNEKEAREHFWLIDKSGLLFTDMTLTTDQIRFARDRREIINWNVPNDYISLLDVVKNIHPTILIGCSTAAGSFTEEIVKIMSATIERPIIMPLSNPTVLAEAHPKDLIEWTDAKAIIATGSPFPNIHYKNIIYRIAQSNNAFTFPGIGLGAIAVKAKHVTDDMIFAATHALSECAPINQDPNAPLLPKISDARAISYKVAIAVGEEARKQGLAQISSSIDIEDAIHKIYWEPVYYPYKKQPE